MKGRRFPFRLRADGEYKGLHLERVGRATVGAWTAFYVLDRPIPPGLRSAERTRSARARAGSRRTRRLLRGAR